jgi:beta-1,4-N-acetylglucosaminyltransferase
MKRKVICLCYGKGGHQEQMQRLIALIEGELPEEVEFVIFSDSEKSVMSELSIIKHYHFNEARDKHSNLKTLIDLPVLFIRQLVECLRVNKTYDVVGVISTGPGVCILPSFIFKLLGKNIVAFESWSRFKNKSLTGIMLNLVSDLFFIQNKSLKKVYRKYLYRGRL